MKKIFTFVCALAVAGSVFAADREGSFALGYQGSFANSSLSSGAGAALGEWSVKYGISSTGTIQALFGLDAGDLDDKTNVGIRYLHDLVENENSDFYTGVGVMYGFNEDTNPDGVLTINVPLGFEWSFAGLPEIGFSAEAGFVVDFNLTDGADTKSVSTIGGNAQWGAHYYF